MALQIIESNGTLQVYGNLNAANTQILKKHLNLFSNAKNYMILNLEKVSGMDATAAHMLRQLYLYAMKNQRLLSIIGEKNPNILPIMNKTKTSYILSHDRV